MLKKGHKRKNWTERWFVLKPNIISYYVSEDLKDKKGDIILDGNCCVEVKIKQKNKNQPTMTVSKDRNLFFFVSMVDLLRALINRMFFTLYEPVHTHSFDKHY